MRAELAAFDELSRELPEVYLAKVDSDIFFLSDKIFRDVSQSGDDLIGHPEEYWEPFIYMQGGCYFLKVSLAGQLSFDERILNLVMEKLNNPTAKEKSRRIDELPEDAAVFLLAKHKTNRIRLKKYIATSYSNRAEEANMVHFSNDKKATVFLYRFGPFFDIALMLRRYSRSLLPYPLSRFFL